MAEDKPRLYEGLFLMDQQVMAGDLNGALSHVREILERGQSEIVSLRKWEDRRLAYEINGQKRGTYLVALFRANPKQIANMERDCNLSELVMRVLFTRADHMGETEIEREQQEAKTSAAEAQLREGPSGETPEEEAEDASEPGPEEEPLAAESEQQQ